MFPDLFSVEGKTALVTGGTRGIGYMIAEGYLRAGARVIITSRKADACEHAQRQLSAFGEVQAIPADLSSVAQCQAVVDEVRATHDRLHILVNNAGATWGASFDEYPDAAWDKVLTLNVKSPFVLTQIARPLLDAGCRDDDPARVINIGSIDGINVPALGTYAYSASKAAIHHLTRHMAAELAPKILVNAIAPGPFPSKMMAATLEAAGDRIAQACLVKRIGKTEDIAAAAIYLSSRATNFMTGAVLPLDGGMATTVHNRI